MTSHSTTPLLSASRRTGEGPPRYPLTSSEELSTAVVHAGVPAVLMVPATVPRTGVRTTRNSGAVAATCSYLDASFTRAEPAIPGRGPEALLAMVMPGAGVDEARVFVEGKLHASIVAANGGWRAYALQAHGWLLLAVVPDRPGVGTAPHLHLVRPAADRVPEARGAA
ncbi:hypothetical protein ACWC5I_45040 [Kitasatospora sp. NPDC001574]